MLEGAYVISLYTAVFVGRISKAHVNKIFYTNLNLKEQNIEAKVSIVHLGRVVACGVIRV